jgi:glucose/arabinose dehydrogenase
VTGFPCIATIPAEWKEAFMRIGLKTVAIACGLAAAPVAAAAQTIGADLVAGGFEAPVFLTAPADDTRLFVVDQPGRIWIVQDGVRLATPFLDISDLVSYGGERGLLGLAFHPDYADNGRFFVDYTNSDGNTRVVAYQVSSDPNRADPNSAKVILGFDQPASNHNGGWLGFGPDGYLYISTGDGGGANNQYGNGQNPDSPLAKILRVDIDSGDPYAIPPTNPWANGGGIPEAFVWGLRNPWRASFDGDMLYIGDVGQALWEEVDVITTADAGTNFGWSIMEGNHCFRADTCDQTGLTLPVHEYSHNVGCSITGGYVYRGAAIPALDGAYFFADYCIGFVSSFRYVDGTMTDYHPWAAEIGDVGRILSFGEDAAGELYILSANGGVYKIVPR